MNAEWFADESLWEIAYPFMFGERTLAAAAKEAEQIVALTGTSGGALLDLGCGPGRHAVELARAGFTVTGVDRLGFLLDKARAQSSDIEWVHQDMRSFARPGAYDLAVCLFTSFGFFDDDADNRKVLTNVFSSLRPHGTFVLDVMGKEILAGIFEPVGASVLPGVGTCFTRRAFKDDFCRIENEWTYVLEDGTVKKHAFRHWVYSAAELRSMMRDAGFGSVRTYGDLQGRPYQPGAPRLITVATRD